MVILLVLLTVLAFIAVEFMLKKREAVVAKGALLLPRPIGHGLPNGLLLHGGHAWTRLDPSGEAAVGLDEFAHGILGVIDRVELPAQGRAVKQGEPVLTVYRSGRKIEFVSPLDGVVSAVNASVASAPAAAKGDPYRAGWMFAVKPTNLGQNLKRLKATAEGPGWLEKETRHFSEFMALHVPRLREVGVTVPDGGAPAEGIVQAMDEALLDKVIRKFLR